MYRLEIVEVESLFLTFNVQAEDELEYLKILFHVTLNRKIISVITISFIIFIVFISNNQRYVQGHHSDFSNPIKLEQLNDVC